MLDSVFDLQRWLYSGAVDALRSASAMGLPDRAKILDRLRLSLRVGSMKLGGLSS
jgi:hypothetical protein